MWRWEDTISGDQVCVTDGMSIKGLELEVLADLIHSGALRHLDYIYVDFHEWIDNDHKSFRYLLT